MEEATLAFTGWEDLLTGGGRIALERTLPPFLARQRWFGGKSRSIERVTLRDAGVAPELDAALLVVEVGYAEGASDAYFVPLVRLPADGARARGGRFPEAFLARCQDGAGEICDATLDEAFCQWLLRVVGRGLRLPFAAGTLVGSAGRAFAEVRGDEGQPLSARRMTAEQSNTSIRFGDKIIMKLFRRLEPGPNPDCELTQYLSEDRGNTHVPTFVGALHYVPRDGERLTLGMLERLIDNQGDGWTWALAELDRYYAACAPRAFPQAWREHLHRTALPGLGGGLSGEAVVAVGPAFPAATLLARRTAEMHIDLAADTANPEIRPARLQASDLGDLAARLRDHALRVFDTLKQAIPTFPDGVVDVAARALGRRSDITERFRGLESLDLAVQATRVHGDYHLGQVLRVTEDFVILDFEGEPARSLTERRSLQSPLKDVAGMLRSFGYAAQVGYRKYVERHPDDGGQLEPWAKLWETGVSAAFLSTYREAVAGTELIPADDAKLELLVGAFVLDKALYELDYEINNRPAWVRIPLLGILGLG